MQGARSRARTPQLESPRAATTEPARSGACATTREKPMRRNKEPKHHNERPRVPQLRPDAAKLIN